MSGRDQILGAVRRSLKRQADDGAVLGDDGARHLARLGEARLLDHVAELAVDGDADGRAHPAVHRRELVARRMARDVDVGVALGDDFRVMPRA